MKLNKNFQPQPTEEGEELFPNGLFEFNITKLLAFITANASKFPMEQVEVSQFAVWDSTNLDEKTIETADLANPIILGEISPDCFNVIDGNHRLERARRQGLATIPAYRVAAAHHVNFLKTKVAYEGYIRYWNSKVEDWEP
ncbi:MAG: ParB N-terminal domain-containing protein [Bdellovibrionaceae bacterium]|nr:ParB N-terminal domain-containing protein [Pseudobdellovibrionaceae bacterium]